MKLAELTAPETRRIAPKAVAVLPLAALEQHGPHLAVSTDTAIVTAVAETVERRLPRLVVLCPTLPYGSSHHHLKFGGTVSVSPEVYAALVVDLAKSLVSGGFRRVVLLNGHGGNITPVRHALARLSHDLDDGPAPNLALATYWELGGKAFAGAPPMETPALSHACEYETSLMLHLFPERVRMRLARRGRRPPHNPYIPWEEEGPSHGVTMPKRTHLISGSGASGDPRLATPAKGRHLVTRAVEATVTFVESFHRWPLMRDLRG